MAISLPHFTAFSKERIKASKEGTYGMGKFCSRARHHHLLICSGGHRELRELSGGHRELRELSGGHRELRELSGGHREMSGGHREMSGGHKVLCRGCSLHLLLVHL
ncbi:unnamed protein product [Boreogadus saida]